ncbi:MAG TPA: alpha/beta hydrolase-fold protein [Actinocrinis sp.]|nr:alpha/beta hydrolase-fold protein [Actinocrinis sp.]
MSLTGVPLLILLTLFTVLLLTVTVLFWPRLATSGPKPIAARIAVLAVAQVFLFSTAAAYTNSYFGFYSTWSDLLGVANTSASYNYAASAPSPLGAGATADPITVNGRQGLDLPGGDDPRTAGQLLDTTIQGETTGLSAHAIIYLPPQYFWPKWAHTRFPAVIVSSGYPGSVTKLVTLLKYPARLADGITAGQDKPMVLIMMSPMIIPGRDTECTDVPDGGPLAGSFWADDVTGAVERDFRVVSDARGWGLVGDSTGGYCALKLAMMNSDKFSAAASLSGYMDALQDRTTGDLYGGSQDFRNLNNLTWRIDHLPPPPIAALLSTSRIGEDNYAPTMAFAAVAKPPMRVSTLIRAQGGHNFDTWNAEVPAALQWLSAQLVSSPPD